MVKTYEKAWQLDHVSLNKLISFHLETDKFFKVYISTTIEFVKYELDDETPEDNIELHLTSNTYAVNNARSARTFLRNARRNIAERVDDMLTHGSNWRVDEVLYTDIHFAAFNPIAGSCGMLSINNLKQIKKFPKDSKKGANQNDCFYEAIAYHFTKSKNYKVLQAFIRKHINRNVKTPIAVKDIDRFLRGNKQLNIAINVVYEEDDEEIYPIYTNSEVKDEDHTITLFLYNTEVDGVLVRHYTHVEDINRLLRRKYNNGRKSYGNALHCFNCLQPFFTRNALSNHRELCLTNKTQRIELPQEDSVMQFEHHTRKFKVPIIGFFDFESSLVAPEHSCDKCKVGISACKHKTVVEHLQIPNTYSIVIVDWTDTVIHTNTYSGEDCMEKFFDELLTLEPRLTAVVDEAKALHGELNMSKEDEVMFQSATACNICDKVFMHDEMRHRDHCHLTGVFLGAAHVACNVNRVVPSTFVLMSHNFTGFDSHFMVKSMTEDKRLNSLKALPYNTEKFRTLSFNNYTFVDSIAFLPSSLEQLVRDLTTTECQFNILDQVQLYPNDRSDLKKLFLRKNVFPYEFNTSLAKLRATKNIPAKEDFSSKLSNSVISDEDYAHATKVWEEFECENMDEYCKMYCLSDTALLAEVMLRFRNEVMQDHGLDCCHYISLPQLAFDCMLKMTGVKIGLISDPDMYLFIEANIRGGSSYVNQRYSKSGLQDGGEEQEIGLPHAREEYIEHVYVDAINLYGEL